MALVIYGPAGTLTVPEVAGLPAAEARAAIERAGLAAALAAGEPAPSPERQFRVQAQEPAAGSAARQGDTVTLRIHGAFDVAAVTANMDCSSWPGTVAVWNAASRNARCECPAPSSWNGAEERCVTPQQALAPPPAAPQPDRCESFANAFWQAMTERRFGDASAILGQSRDCEFFGRGAAALQGEHNLACQQLESQIRQACQQRDRATAQNLIQQAFTRNCRISLEAQNCNQGTSQIDRQQWNQMLGAMSDLIRIQQQQGNRRSNPPLPTLTPGTAMPVGPLPGHRPALDQRGLAVQSVPDGTEG